MRYALVNKETNTVDNIILWDGNINIWQPPETHQAVFAEDKLTLLWVWNSDLNDYEQKEFVDSLDLGLKWDGTKFVEVKKPETPILTN
jgi:hypothetical protein